MATEAHCPKGNCSSLGIEATPLDRFAHISTEDGELLVYDRDNEDAWIQSDLYYVRESVV